MLARSEGFLAGAVALALLLAGCGGAAGGGSGSGGTSTAATTRRTGTGAPLGPTGTGPTASPTTRSPVASPSPAASPSPPSTAPAPVAPGTASFAGDWLRDPAQGGFAAIQAVNPDRLRRDPAVATWHGLAAARVTVAPGDDPIGTGTERAEVLGMVDASGASLDETPASGTVFLGVSYQLPTGFQSTASPSSSDWSCVLQLHGPDSLGASPSLSLHADQGVWRFFVDAGDLATSPVTREVVLATPAFALGQWTDFVIRIAFATDSTGHVTIWRRDEGATAFTQVADAAVPTLQYDSRAGGVGAHYWKQGLYRGQSHGLTNVFWMGPTSRAATFDGAEGAAFGTHAGP